MTISRDLKAVRESWRTSSVRNFEADRARLLEELALAKREAWAAWDNSKTDGDGNPCKPDVKYFNALLDCWAREADLLGLSMPDLIVQQNMNNQQVAAAGVVPMLSLAERRDAIKNLLVEVARSDGDHSEAASLLALMDGTTPLEQDGNGRQVTVPDGRPVTVPEFAPQANGEYDADGQAGRMPYGLKELPGDALDDDVQPLDF
jgi:hypothetical protein